MTVVFWVSGHGFGHAARTASILRSLQSLRPEWRIIVRTAAPGWLFPGTVEVHPAQIDSSVVETADALSIDTAATLDALLRHRFRERELLQQETDFLRAVGANLLVADIPYLAGEAAANTGIPCVAIGNFTWDWIYEPMLPAGSEWIGRMRDAYSQMKLALRLPLSQPAGWEMFGEVADVPLVARPPVLAQRLDPRPTVLLAGRGRLADESVQKAALACDDFYFVSFGDAPRRFRNWQVVQPGPALPFAAVLGACDIVLAKLGYSLAADCIAANKRMVYPPRTGFREDAILRAEIGRHIPALPIPVEPYLEGDWGSHLRAVCEMPPVVTSLEANGAETCAQRLVLECE